MIICGKEFLYIQEIVKGGRSYLYFRRPGLRVKLPHPTDPTFDEIYNRCRNGEVVVAPVVSGRKAERFTLRWLWTEYSGSTEFLKRPEHTQDKHRRYIEWWMQQANCETHHWGEISIKAIDYDQLEKIHLFDLRFEDTPAAADDWLRAVRDIFKFAVRKKYVATNPTTDLPYRNKKKPGWTMTRDEVRQYRNHHPVGSKPRLALELGIELCLRISDLIRIGPHQIKKVRTNDGRLVSQLTYTQKKNGETDKARTLTVTLSERLLSIIAATKLTGSHAFMLNEVGKPYYREELADGSGEGLLSGHFAKWIEAAGLAKPGAAPHEVITVHSLRRRGCVELVHLGCDAKRIGAVSGHVTMKELERYTKMVEQETLAGEVAEVRNVAHREGRRV